MTSPPSHRLRLGHREAQALVLVRAVEEVDRRGAVLPHEARRQATAEASPEGSGDAWLGRRALALAAVLERRWSFLPRLLRATDLARGLLAPAAVVAFAAGVATNALGPEKRVHVLALPLAGVLAWNLAVLAFLAVRRAVPWARVWRGARPWLLDALEGWIRRLVGRLPAAADAPDVTREALAAYLRNWLPALAPLAAARIRRLLHAAALLLVAGAVAGMYLRGVVFEYRAAWESTFLSGAQVDAVLGAVLAPAAAVLGTDVPPVERLQDDNAAPWIHLWALTAALFVVLPRALLALAESVRVARLGRRLPIEVTEVYLRRLLAAVSSSTQRVEVVPYSYRLPAALADALRARLHDVFGARSEIRFRPPVEYGTPAGELELAVGRCWLVVFNLAQTPEIEVHGRFVAALAEASPDGQRLAIVVDGSAFRDRLPGEEKRWEERRRAWDRVVDGAGLAAVHLDLRRDDADRVVAALLEEE
ncbi:MAG TPA: DUF2868 domain-containing protein [Thermoanaerobaculia bacterium]|jgi:hypothetical protein